MKEFSFIVPVYNVEKYLKKCIDSLLCQTFADYEMILVDDGSPDNCGAICDSYQSRDSRIVVIHKENGGLSSARNAGLDIARGKYIIFVDSDDFWDDVEALDQIHLRLSESNADVLVFPAKRYYEEDDQYTYLLRINAERDRITNSDTEEAVRYLLENNIYRAAAWNKVVKKSLIDNYGMRFQEGRLSEDMDWCGNLLLYSKRFDFYENPLYAYRQQRSGSITAGKNQRLVSDKLYFCELGYRQALMLQASDPVKAELLADYYAYEYAVLLGVSGAIRDKETLSRIRALEKLLEYDLCKKVRIVHRLKSLIGFSLTRKVLCLFVQIKR